MLPEGRKALQGLKNILKGSDWYEIVFPNEKEKAAENKWLDDFFKRIEGPIA